MKYVLCIFVFSSLLLFKSTGCVKSNKKETKNKPVNVLDSSIMFVISRNPLYVYADYNEKSKIIDTLNSYDSVIVYNNLEKKNREINFYDKIKVNESIGFVKTGKLFSNKLMKQCLFKRKNSIDSFINCINDSTRFTYEVVFGEDIPLINTYFELKGFSIEQSITIIEIIYNFEFLPDSTQILDKDIGYPKYTCSKKYDKTGNVNYAKIDWENEGSEFCIEMTMDRANTKGLIHMIID